MDTLSELEALVLSEVFYAFYRMNSIRRAADWWQVMEGIYGSEGIPHTSDTEQIRPVTRGCEADTGATRIPVPHLRENPINGAMGDRSPACEELEEDAA